MKCEQCKFFDPVGECHESGPQATVILAPRQHHLTGQVQMIPTPVSSWPQCPPDGWCGKYQDQIALYS